MAFYYYLVSGLPELLTESLPKRLDHFALKVEILEHLNKKDAQWMEQLYWPYDNASLLKLAEEYLAGTDKREFFLDRETDNQPDCLGTYSIRAIKQAFKDLEGLPPYMIEFIEKVQHWDKSNSGLNNLEHELLELFYKTVRRSRNTFVREYFMFDAALRNILLAQTLRKLQKLEVQSYFVGDEELVQILKKSSSPDFGLKGVVEFADALFQILEIENWIEREQKLDMLRWSFVDERVQFSYFTSESVFAFALKLQWIDRWQRWNPEQGKKMLSQLSEQVGGTVNLELLTQ